MTTATHDNCPICIQNQPKGHVPRKTTFTSFQEWGGARKISYAHLHTHVPQVREAIEAHCTVSEDVMKNAIEAVLNQIENHGSPFNDTTIEAVLSVLATYDDCPFCIQKQFKATFDEIGKFLSRNERDRRTHLKEHIKKDIQGHYKLELDCEWLRKAITAVFDQICYRKAYTPFIIERGLAVMLRHKVGSDDLKDNYANVLGGRKRDQKLTKRQSTFINKKLYEISYFFLKNACAFEECPWGYH